MRAVVVLVVAPGAGTGVDRRLAGRDWRRRVLRPWLCCLVSGFPASLGYTKRYVVSAGAHSAEVCYEY